MPTDWKRYEVKAELSWWSDAEQCHCDITIRIIAKSPGHAISRVKDRLRNIGGHVVDEINATEIVHDE